MNQPEAQLPSLDAEWLETDGLGGFASGTVGGIRTRRYHALLMPAVRPPEGRAALVDGFDAWVESQGNEAEYLTRQAYLPDIQAGRADGVLIGFTNTPWPTWRFRLGSGVEIEQELFLVQEQTLVAVRWRLVRGRGDGRILRVRPFVSGRESHALIHESQLPTDDAVDRGCLVRFPVAAGYPHALSLSNGDWHLAPERYRNFLHAEERARGFDHAADLAAPGALAFDLSRGDAVWILSAERQPGHERLSGAEPGELFHTLRSAEKIRRGAFPDRLSRAGDQYLVQRGAGKSIIAGYPWFTDWGRDTFIALRGLCLATGRLDDARDILLQWAGSVDQGQVPNRFVEEGGAAEFNAVDASLWYIIAAHEYIEACRATGRRIPGSELDAIHGAFDAILTGYADGTRYGIKADPDGLLRAGEPGVQLTWMDARVGDWVVTPRIGKPVEVQALWLNALRIAAPRASRWRELFKLGSAAFEDRFWNEERQGLYDVVDADHEPGKLDPLFRPNQIFAVGGLPFPVTTGSRAAAIVESVERLLWTPMGLRSLAPGEPGYIPRYQGGPRERDAAYHQGTVWPWLLGAFVEGWLRVRDDAPGAREEARARFLMPLLAHLDEAGLGHISEIADAEAPYTPRGCPFQAWSVGEALRIDRVILAERRAGVTAARHRKAAAR